MAFIKCENLSYIYNQGRENEYKALDNINLEIEKGQFISILGTNGSGKSTLAKHFNALLVPAAGHCLIDGMDTRAPEHLWDIRGKVGMVFQNPDNQIIAAIVEDDVGFGPENIAPHLLSGGQKQRIAIAGALAMETEVLVLDEPTAMLDPAGRREVMATVHELNQERSITVINITHFMEEAAMSDRVIVMSDGRIMEDGTPQDIFSHIKEMKALGLAVPMAAEMAYKLQEKGIRLPQTVISQEDLVKALCQ